MPQETVEILGWIALLWILALAKARSAASISAAISANPAAAGQNQRNRRRREAEGQLAASLGRYSPQKGMRLPRSLPSALLPLRATHPSILTVS
jgi:hypothetical protein